MMNENSPICARLSPLITEVFSVAPDNRAPNPQNSERPMMATKAMTTMAPRFSVTAAGVTSMPTDTKNTAPNRSLMGLNSASTRIACTVPARMDPARNAPSAEENPMASARTTIPKHSAMDAMSRISSLSSERRRLRALGTRMTLSANHTTRYSAMRPIRTATAPPSTDALTATVAEPVRAVAGRQRDRARISTEIVRAKPHEEE